MQPRNKISIDQKQEIHKTCTEVQCGYSTYTFLELYIDSA